MRYAFCYLDVYNDKTKQNKTKQNNTKQNKTKQNKTKQNKTKNENENKNRFRLHILVTNGRLFMPLFYARIKHFMSILLNRFDI